MATEPITIQVSGNVNLTGIDHAKCGPQTLDTIHNQTDKPVVLESSDGERITLEPNTVHVIEHVNGRTYRVLGPEELVKHEG
jgi:hypothetical protein